MRYKLGTLDLMESFYLSFFSYRKESLLFPTIVTYLIIISYHLVHNLHIEKFYIPDSFKGHWNFLSLITEDIQVKGLKKNFRRNFCWEL